MSSVIVLSTGTEIHVSSDAAAVASRFSDACLARFTPNDGNLPVFVNRDHVVAVRQMPK